METEGYEIQPFILPACAVGAPHRRDRCWFVAHRADAGIETMQERQDGTHAAGTASDADRDRCRIRTYQQKYVTGSCGSTYDCNGGANGIVADAHSQRRHKLQSSAQPSYAQEWYRQDGDAKRRIPDWGAFPTQPPVYRRDDGLPFDMDGITFPKWRNQSIKAYGNAIVPQVALQIFETINEIESVFRPSGE